MAIADITDLQWVTCFSEAAETILEMKVDELGRLKDEVFSIFYYFSFF